MKTSDKGLMALIAHEGVVLTRYKDAVGVWTIGVGRTAAAGGLDPKTFYGKMTMRQAFDLLRHDVIKYENAVNKAIKVPLKQHEFDALVSFHYNTGAIARASLTKHINAGNKAAAAKAFMSWTKGGGRVLPALVERRKAERALFSSGTYPKPIANLYPATPDGRVQWSKATRIDLVRELQVSTPAPISVQKPTAEVVNGGNVQKPPSTSGGKVAATGLIALVAAAAAKFACSLPLVWRLFDSCTGG